MTLVYGEPTLFGTPAVVAVKRGPVEARVIDKATADNTIKAGHYSGTVTWSSNVHLGIYLNGDMAGAMQFGPAMNPASGDRVVAGSATDSWLELNRLWLTDDKPANTTSRAISCGLRLLREVKPRVQWVQSFADERCGKLGAVYQACSFLYCGYHESQFYEIDGTWVHRSMMDRPAVDKRGWGQGPRVAWVKANRERAVPHTFRQYRYIKFLDRRAEERLRLPVLPYPKPEALERAA